jgi:hypothetical protein
MWHVWLYLTSAQTALYLGNQNAPKKNHMGVYMYDPPRLNCRHVSLAGTASLYRVSGEGFCR